MLRARMLTWYPRLCAAASTFSRVSGATLAPGVKVRDTAERDTPASSATSTEVTEVFCLSDIGELVERFECIGRWKAPARASIARLYAKAVALHTLAFPARQGGIQGCPT